MELIESGRVSGVFSSLQATSFVEVLTVACYISKEVGYKAQRVEPARAIQTARHSRGHGLDPHFFIALLREGGVIILQNGVLRSCGGCIGSTCG